MRKLILAAALSGSLVTVAACSGSADNANEPSDTVATGEAAAGDMASEATTQELRTSASLVQRFAFPGTPALVVGRTIVIGTIRKATLNSLIAAESDEGPPPGC